MCAPVVLPGTLQTVPDYQRTVHLRFGKALSQEAGKGGLYIVLPFIDELRRVDVREKALDIPKQSIITVEGLTISVDGVVYYKIIDPVRSVFGVTDFIRSVSLLAQTKLREVLGSKTFEELQTKRGDSK